MSQFTGHLGLNLLEYSNGRPVTKGGRVLWWAGVECPYEVGELGSGEFVTMPAFDRPAWDDLGLRRIAKGLDRPRGVTDLTSIPRICRGVLSPDGPYVKAAIPHDDLYVTRGYGGRYSRKDADEILYEAMGVLGVANWQRYAIYAAVRAGGAGAWGT